MANKLDIINKSLALMGETPISDFSGDKGQVIDLLYDIVKENFLTAARWRFAMKKVAITVDGTAPLNDWNYRYAIPTDLLMLIRVYGVGNWEIFETWIYAQKSNGIEIDYLYSPNEKDLPKYAEWALACELSYQLSLSITNKLSLVQVLEKRAEDALAKAMFKDAQSQPARSVLSKPYVAVRK
jgi:hypothetical protein